MGTGCDDGVGWRERLGVGLLGCGKVEGAQGLG